MAKQHPELDKADELCERCFHNDICRHYERAHAMRIAVHARLWEEKDCPSFVTAEAVCERKHGKWETIKSGDGIFDYYFRCSVCKGNTPDKAYVVAPDWCPSCGAIMDGKKETD